MDNIFVVGKEVSGESMIGYHDYQEKLTNRLLEGKSNISMTGIMRIGKSSLAKAALKNVEAALGETVLILKVNLGKCKSYGDFLEKLFGQLEESIIERETLDSDRVIQKYFTQIDGLSSDSATYRDKLDAIFKRIKKLKYRVIFMIDEFDNAADLFPSTAEYEYIRDLSSNQDEDVQLLIVSRRQIYMIENKNFNNSTFHGIIRSFPVCGFDEQDMKEYHALLKSRYDIELSDEQKRLITRYAGRSPFLWSMFGYDMVEAVSQKQEINIRDIFRGNEIDIVNYCKSVYECMKNDRIENDVVKEKCSSSEKVVGILLGPCINVTETDVSLLIAMGYLSENENERYAISYYFTDFLKEQGLEVDSWTSIISTEKKLKLMIRRELQRRAGVEEITYDAIANLVIAVGAEATLATYDNFIENTARDFKEMSDLLDVMSLDLAVSIIKYEWENVYTKFFNNDPWEKWEYRLRTCAKARNPLAHGHEEYLSENEKSVINVYCDEIMQTLQKSGACNDSDTELLVKANMDRIQYTNKYYLLSAVSTYPSTLVGVEVDFCAAVQVKDGIKGYFEYLGKEYKQTIKKEKWKQKYPDSGISNHIGKTHKIKVTVNNPQCTNVSVELV